MKNVKMGIFSPKKIMGQNDERIVITRVAVLIELVD